MTLLPPAGTRSILPTASQPNDVSRTLLRTMTTACIHIKHPFTCESLVPIFVCLGLLAATPAGSQPITVVDDSADIPTIDGNIGAGEYAGLSLGVGATGGLLGDGSVLGIDASLSDVAFGLETAGAVFATEVAVLYLDTSVENNSPTSPLVALGGPRGQRRAMTS